MAATRTAGWIPELATVRALAALAVLGFHLVSLDPPGGVLGDITTPLGNAAVAVFFVLSGFLVFRPFARWALLDGPSVRTVSFWVRRAVRILPLYWAILAVHLAIEPGRADLTTGDIVAAITLTQNFQGTRVFVPPFVAWSLCIELWFSVALPLLAAPMRRLARSRPLADRVRIHLAGCVVLAATAIAFRVWAVQAPGSGRVLWVPAYLDWFAGGLALATLSTMWSASGTGPIARALAPRPWYLAGLGTLCYWVVTRLGLPGGFVTPTPFQTHVQFLVQALMATLLVGALVIPGLRLGRIGPAFRSGLFAYLGALSYGIYLAHPVVIDEIARRRPGWDIGSLLVVGLPITVVVAHVLHRTIERPASAIVDRLIAPRPRRTTWSAPTIGVIGASTTDPATTDATAPAASRPEGAPLRSIVGHRRLHELLVVVVAVIATTLALPGRTVVDSRFELVHAPLVRWSRQWIGWDASRGIGRVAEEFWPGLTALAGGLDLLSTPPWLAQRVVHAVLLALAGIGAHRLSLALRPDRTGAALVSATLYGFGPWAAIYLVPIPLFLGHVVAPWAVLAVLHATSFRRAAAAGGAIALLVAAAGNADPPGLAIALLPAAVTAATALTDRRRRRPVLTFAFVATLLTVTASATMAAKTLWGAAALSHRLAETESIDVIAAATSLSESLRGHGFWLLVFRLDETAFRDHLAPYVSSPAMVAITFLPLAVGVLGLRWDRSRSRLLAVSWVIVGAVVMAGPHPVDRPTTWGRLLLEGMESNDLIFAFRSSHKAIPVVALGTAVLAGWGTADLLERAHRYRRSLGVVLTAAALATLATLGSPFWRTPLYDARASSGPTPDYWHEVGSWLADHADGRVLVLPGSTNNGYTWGTVGDDLVDVFVARPVVASTLPLSTPEAAALVDELDRIAVERPELLQPWLDRLGITHVLVRNDLRWERQGVAPPSSFDHLRAAPWTTTAATFGDVDDDGSSRPAVEIFEVVGGRPPRSEVLPAQGEPRRILVDGGARTLVEITADGVGDLGHAVQTVDGAHPVPADDVALVVVSNLDRPLHRRIVYYGFEYAVDDAADDGLAGGIVWSSVDPFLLGVEHEPMAAVDGDPASAWIVPLLVADRPQSLVVEFDEPTEIGELRVDLRNADDLLEPPIVRVDDRSVPTQRDGDTLTVAVGRADTIEVVVGPTRAGSPPAGVVDLWADGGPVLAAEVRLDDSIGEVLEPPSPANLPARVLLAPVRPTSHPFEAVVTVSSSGPLNVRVEVIGDVAAPACRDDVVRIGDRPIAVRPTATDRDTTLFVACRLDLIRPHDPGLLEVQVTPPADTVLRRIEATIGELPIDGPTRIPLADRTVATDDILLLPHAADDGWRLQGVDATPLALDSRAAFRIDDSGSPTPVHQADVAVQRTIPVTVVAVGISLVLVAWGLTPHGRRETIARSTSTPGRRRRSAWVRALVAGGLLCAASLGGYAVAGPWAAGAALASGAVARWRPSATATLVAGSVILLGAATVQPLVEGSSIVRADAARPLGAVVLGALAASGLVWAASAGPSLDHGVPTRELTDDRDRHDPTL